MSFTARIRLYLFLVALLPPALMIGALYIYSSQQHESLYRRNSASDIERVTTFREEYTREVAASLQRAVETDWFSEASQLAERGSESRVEVDARRFGLDFLEVIDDSDRVVASAHRPGLIGEALVLPDGIEINDSVTRYETIEYDTSGQHPSFAYVVRGESPYALYGGVYMNKHFRGTLDQIIHGQTAIRYLYGDRSDDPRLKAMVPLTLYMEQDSFKAVVAGHDECGFYLMAYFDREQSPPYFATYFNLMLAVAVLSVLAAMGIGFYISSRFDREISNLVDAFSRVAGGDLSTTVMAYQPGEFAELADAFSEMTTKLRRSQRQLAVAEKVAAWEAIGRKIAHEVKNPLTPIAICADDLRRSYQEKLPGFDETLDRSTRMIKEEVDRLRRMLDEFVSFARMATPTVSRVDTAKVFEDIKDVYGDILGSGRLHLQQKSERQHLNLDSQQIKQVLVNLIKNGLEASPTGAVEVSLEDTPTGIRVIVADNGPGFTNDMLAHAFEPYFTSKATGSGLGLVICQRIIHDHGGSIELSNRQQGGAAVEIRLPQD